MPLIALTRDVSPAIARCELTHLEREPIDWARAVEQHNGYERMLEQLGCIVQRLPSLPDNPDAVFVEDTAVALQELAIITRPGAESRRSEIASVADALRNHREVASIEPPGTLDGGDVLVVGSTIFVGESTRTNAEGIRQLGALAAPHGYLVRGIQVSGCLHLKSAATRVGEDTVLLNPRWVEATLFGGFETIEIDDSEPAAANAVSIGRELIYPTGFDRTAERLERLGFTIHSVEMHELQKAEGAVTCCSILLS